MLTLSATQFVNNFGQRTLEVQVQPIEVQSHGRTVGFYVSPAEYKRMQDALHHISEPMSYHSIKSLVHARKDEILAIARKYGVKKIRLFGSVARGEDTLQSDIDFLIEYPAGHVPSFDDLGIGSEIGDLFEGRRVDIVDAARVDQRLKSSILADAVEL